MPDAACRSCRSCGSVLGPRTVGRYPAVECLSCRAARERALEAKRELRVKEREALRQSRLPVPLGLCVVENGPVCAVDERSPDRVWTGGDCHECGGPFVARGAADKFCSVACRRRTERRSCKARRKARKLGGEVIRSRDVFERDGWRCHICHKSVKRDAVVPHPRAPTVDHIVPLACGGEHAMRNVQTAHFLCNSVKSAGCANDQLRLV